MRHAAIALIVVIAAALWGTPRAPSAQAACPEPPPTERYEEAAFVVVPDSVPAVYRQGERVTISGVVQWPSGRPVWGLSPENIARFNSGEEIVDDCLFEGGIVTLGLHFPLAPDYTARAVDVVTWTVVDWRGRFEVSARMPWVLYPGEERVHVDALLTVTACDRPAQMRGVMACAHMRIPLSLVVVPGDHAEVF
jgi:hypothetical protein